MEVHGSLSVLLDTALCSIVPIFCLTSQLPVMAGCSHETQVKAVVPARSVTFTRKNV